MHPSQFPLYGNPGAMSLERERLGIPPGHHVGMDPNDPMVSFERFFFIFLHTSNFPLSTSSTLLQQQPDVSGFQLPREFVFKAMLHT